MSTPGYNPQFVYHAIPDAEYALLRGRLEALHPDGTAIGQLFERTRGYLLRRLKLRQVIGTSKFWDPDLYGQPTEDLIAIAEEILEARPALEHTTDSIHTADRLVTMCEQALRQHGLGDWRVIARPHISSSNVESANRLIIVRADQLYSMTAIKRLIVHE